MKDVDHHATLCAATDLHWSEEHVEKDSETLWQAVIWRDLRAKHDATR